MVEGAHPHLYSTSKRTSVCSFLTYRTVIITGSPLGKYPYTEGWNLLDKTSLLYSEYINR